VKADNRIYRSNHRPSLNTFSKPGTWTPHFRFCRCAVYKNNDEKSLGKSKSSNASWLWLAWLCVLADVNVIVGQYKGNNDWTNVMSPVTCQPSTDLHSSKSATIIPEMETGIQFETHFIPFLVFSMVHLFCLSSDLLESCSWPIVAAVCFEYGKIKQ